MADSSHASKTNWKCWFCSYSNPLSAYPKCRSCARTTSYSHKFTTDEKNGTSKHDLSGVPTIGDRQHKDEIEANRIADGINSHYRRIRGNFVDDEFPPTSSSIGSSSHSYKWVRITETKSSSHAGENLEWTIFSSPQPSDIEQGRLGNCWLMAALAIVAERPAMLENIILTKNVNPEGVYLLRLCHSGVWKKIAVDDYFPCEDDRQPVFAKVVRRQLYVPLIEKACAKLFGSYTDLKGGTTQEGLQLLTGAPCLHIDLHPRDFTLDADLVWAKLLSALETKLLVGASTSDANGKQEEFKRVHIHPSHAYSLLAANVLSNQNMRFVLVRDPHGQMNYREHTITQNILRQLNSFLSFRLPAGAFWISWRVFIQFFDSITISSYEIDNYDLREVARFTESSNELVPAYHFYLSKASSMNISLCYHHENRRAAVEITETFVLCDIEHDGRRRVGRQFAVISSRRGTFTHWMGSLSAGNYVLIPFSTSFWNRNTDLSQRRYTLVIQSKTQVNVEVVPERPTLLADCLIASISEESFNRQKYKNFNYYITTGKYDIALLIVENLSPTDYLNINVDAQDSSYARSSRQVLATYDSIPPHHRQIIFLIEGTNRRGQTQRINSTIKSSFSKEPKKQLSVTHDVKHDFHSCRRF